MKVIIVDSLFSAYGGGQKIAYGTYKMLISHGIEAFYWGMDKRPYFDNKYEYIKYFTPLYQGSGDYVRNPIKYYYNYRALNDFQKFIDLIQPNLIHFQSFWGLSSAVFKAKTKGAKILTIHDPRCCPAVTLMYKNKIYCNPIKCKNKNFLSCIFNKCAKSSYEASIRHAVASYIEVNNFKNINTFITPSDALKKVITQANIGIGARITTISNFLDNEELCTIPNYSDKGYFLYVGRLSSEKGAHYLLEAMKELPSDIKLHIVGTGAEETKLKHYAEENNLTNVEFLGYKNREEIKDEYQNCIAVIVPSNWFEIFGMINIEAMINGKPVIGSNIGGIPEIIENNKTGLLFEPANVEQLKECILKYWNKPELAIEHGKNGYKKALASYTEETYYKKLMNLYEETINEYK